MEKQREGVLSTWIAGRGFGFIILKNGTAVEKFYLHVSRIQTGTPIIGQTVRFNILPVSEGNYPSAIEAEFITPPVAPDPLPVTLDGKAGS